MKVGLDAKRAFHNVTGLGNYARGVLRALVRHAPELRVVAYSPPGGRAAFDAPGPWERRGPRGALARALPSAWRQLGLARDALRDGVEVFHGLSAELPLGAGAALPAVVTVHDLIWERLPHLYRAPDRLIYRAKCRSAAARARVVVAVSAQTRDDLVTLYGVPPERIRVVYQGADPVFQAPAADPVADEAAARSRGLAGEYVLSVGTVEPRKNLLAVVRALPGLPGVDLAVVGRETPYAADVRAEAESLGVAGRVRFLAGVPMEELAALYRRATALAYPSFYEGFGIPIVEALFSGTPVVTTRGGCFAEAGGPGSLYVDPASPGELREALQAIRASPARRAEMRARGLEHAERFGDAAIARALVAVYGEALRS